MCKSSGQTVAVRRWGERGGRGSRRNTRACRRGPPRTRRRITARRLFLPAQDVAFLTDEIDAISVERRGSHREDLVRWLHFATIHVMPLLEIAAPARVSVAGSCVVAEELVA